MTQRQSRHPQRRDWLPQPFGNRGIRAIPDPLIEPLWEGQRVLVHASADDVEIVTPDGDFLADDFPEIVEAVRSAVSSDDSVLDGYLTIQATRPGEGTALRTVRTPTSSEVTAQMLLGGLASQGEHRLERALASPVGVPGQAIALVLIDLLVVDGEELLDLPLLERKRLLDSVVEDGELVRRTPFVRPPVDPWISSWRSQGFRGLAYKAANSRYSPGTSGPDWARAEMPPNR